MSTPKKARLQEREETAAPSAEPAPAPAPTAAEPAPRTIRLTISSDGMSPADIAAIAAAESALLRVAGAVKPHKYSGRLAQR